MSNSNISTFGLSISNCFLESGTTNESITCVVSSLQQQTPPPTSTNFKFGFSCFNFAICLMAKSRGSVNFSELFIDNHKYIVKQKKDPSEEGPFLNFYS